ncbi:MAG: thiamine diphosphokinase [Bacteroidales bacterium]|jgi:thiamine pyrophosphokinase|nr:thiamine diphosphokinase [Bacteroidales bacterium]
MSLNAVIVADGNFPVHKTPLEYLENADAIICCDGSTESVLNAGIIPDAIVGDMDSLSAFLSDRFADRIYIDENQETNDLTKAVEWCRGSGYDDIVIVGATGKREDHTIGNISLLAEYSKFIKVKMVTDTGIILPFHESCRIETFPGQNISIFSIDPENEITSSGLRYSLERKKLRNWWEATLNEAIGYEVELRFEGGPVLVFLLFNPPPPPAGAG